MRPIGTTERGGRIVEMSADEWREFASLQLAAEGRTEIYPEWERDHSREFDLTGVFGAIRLQTLCTAEANRLVKLADDVRNFFRPKTEKTP